MDEIIKMFQDKYNELQKLKNIPGNNHDIIEAKQLGINWCINTILDNKELFNQ